MRHALLALSLALLFLVAMLPGQTAAEPLPLPYGFVSVADGELVSNGTEIAFNGINDQTVFYIQFFWLVNGYPQYRYSNHLFDSDTGHYSSDTATILDSDNYTHFWWQYFYLVKHLGLNMVRLGAFEESTLVKCMDAFYNHTQAWNAVMEPMLDMAEANGVYIDFCIGGGDPVYGLSANYLSYSMDLMALYANETAIAIWDMCNEAYTLSSASTYWDTAGGYLAYLEWRVEVSAFAQAHAGDHLVTSDGFGNLSKGYGEPGWSEPFISDTFDLCDGHVYFSADDDYLVTNQVAWASNLDRPLFWGECALNSPIDPPYWWYWPWLHDISQANRISTVWMTLWNYTGYPVAPSTIDAIPGIPFPEGFEEEELPVVPDEPVPDPDFQELTEKENDEQVPVKEPPAMLTALVPMTVVGCAVVILLIFQRFRR